HGEPERTARPPPSGRSLDLASNGEARGMVVIRRSPQGRRRNRIRLTASLRSFQTMASYLVTGGAGFIGSHLAEELLRRGQRVRVADSLITGKRQNLDHLNGVDFLEGDLADFSVCERAVDGVEYVLHQAAIPSVPRSINDPLT